MTNQVLRGEDNRIGSVLHTVDFSLLITLKKNKTKKKTEKPEELRFEFSPGYDILISPWPRLREKWLNSFYRNVFD